MKVRDVRLEALMRPCLYYCLQRVRPGMSFAEFDTLPRYDMPENETEIPVGAILWYNNAEKEKEWLLTVEDKTVVSVFTYNRGHYMVHEGDGLVSDLAWTEKGEPYIRFRYLRDGSPPDKLILVE